MNFRKRKIKIRFFFSIKNESDTDSIDETIDGISIPSVSENTLIICLLVYFLITESCITRILS